LRCPAEASPDIAGSLPADRGTRLCPASSATGGAGQRGLRLAALAQDDSLFYRVIIPGLFVHFFS